MLEIIHDLAPGAQLYFATRVQRASRASRSNIRDLRAAGCDIIVDDVVLLRRDAVPGRPGAGVVSQHERRRRHPGGEGRHRGRRAVLLVRRQLRQSQRRHVGRLGRRLRRRRRDGCAAARGGPPAQLRRGRRSTSLTAPERQRPISLYWSDPLGGSSNDYDLFVLNAAGTAVVGELDEHPERHAGSVRADPGRAPRAPRIVIVQEAAAQPARFLHLNTNRGRLAIATAGQTHGHSAVAA